MMAQNGIGNRLGFNFSDNPDDESNIPDWAMLGVINSVAISICPYFEKPIHPALVKNATVGMRTISSITAEVAPVQKPNTMPVGSGNHPIYSNQYNRKEDRVITSNDFLRDDGDDIVTT
jgi:hypothetical protein